MTKYLLALVLFGFASQAKSEDIKDFVQYQNERCRTFDDAHAYHKQTKKTVIFWVGVEDNFNLWMQTRNLGYNVFLKSYPKMNSGITVAKDVNGVFTQMGTVKADFDAINRLVNPLPQLVFPPDCPNGKCPRRVTFP